MTTGDMVEVWNTTSSGKQTSLRYAGRIVDIIDDDHFREGPSYCVKPYNKHVEWVPEVSIRPL